MSTGLSLKALATLSMFSRFTLSGGPSTALRFVDTVHWSPYNTGCRKTAKDFVTIDSNQLRALAKLTSSQATLELSRKRFLLEITQGTLTAVMRRTQYPATVCSVCRTTDSCITEIFSRMKHEAHFNIPCDTAPGLICCAAPLPKARR